MKKMLVFLFSLTLVGVLNFSAFANGFSGPVGTITIGTVNFNITFDQKSLGSGKAIWATNPFTISNNNDWVFEVSSILFNSDPVITYSFTVTNNTTSLLEFGLMVNGPIVPVSNPNTVFASLSYNLTDQTNNGLWFVPIGETGRVFTQLSDVGPSITPMGVDLDPSGATIWETPCSAKDPCLILLARSKRVLS